MAIALFRVLAVAVLAGCLLAVPVQAARLVSPAGGQQVIGEAALLDELQPLQGQLRDIRLAPVVPLQYEHDPGEVHPTGIEVVGVARGGHVPSPNPQRANKLVSSGVRGFDPDRDPFWVYTCSPEGAHILDPATITSCDEVPLYVPAAAGTYYWHVRPSRTGCFGLPQNCLLPWTGQVESFSIPSVFRVNGLQIPPRTRSCVTGAVLRYDTNEPSPVARYAIRVYPVGSTKPALRLSGRTGGKRTGVVQIANGEYQHVVRVPLNLVRAGRYWARLRLIDTVGHSGSGRSRNFTVPNPSASCRLPRLRPN